MANAYLAAPIYRLNGHEYEAILSITHEACSLVGLDDGARYSDVVRVPNGRFVLCAGPRDAIIDLLTELNDRATEGADGFGHSAAERAIGRRNVARNIRHYGRFGILPRE